MDDNPNSPGVRDFFNRLEALVDLPHIDINLKDSQGRTPMFIATCPNYFHLRPRIAEIFYHSRHEIDVTVKNVHDLTFFEKFLMSRTSNNWTMYVFMWLEMCCIEEAVWVEKQKKYLKQLTDRYHEKHGLPPDIFRAHVLPYLSDVPHFSSNQRLISWPNYRMWRNFNANRQLSEDEASSDSDSSIGTDVTEMEVDFLRFLHDFIYRHDKSQF